MTCYATLPLFLGLVAASALLADEQPARGGGRPAAAAKKPGGAGNPGNQAQDQFQKLLDMTPEDREEFLKDLLPARRQPVVEELDRHNFPLLKDNGPIGRDDNARAILKFGWRAETEDVSPQNDILLQVLVDAVAERLSALQSPLAPQPATPAPEGADEAQRVLASRVS